MLNNLTEYELKELISKGGHLGFEMLEPDEREKADKVGGIGYSNKKMNSEDTNLSKEVNLN